MEPEQRSFSKRMTTALFPNVDATLKGAVRPITTASMSPPWRRRGGGAAAIFEIQLCKIVLISQMYDR